MKSLHEHNISSSHIEPKEEQRKCLCSNNTGCRCSSLDFNSDYISEDIALDYLASIIVEIFLDMKNDEYNNSTNK